MTDDAAAFETSAIIESIGDWLREVQLVPPALAGYAGLITDGLLFFLERLPAARLQAIVEDQLALDEAATPHDRLIALLRQCPTLHKLGQVIAHESGLPLELRRQLQLLESIAPRPGNRDIARTIERELGNVAGLRVANDALAEGSVAFVVPFNWDTPPAGVPRRGVFKALKPNAERDLLDDLAIWPALGDFLGERSAADGLGAFEFRSTLNGVAKLLLDEIRLDREQEHIAWAQRFYAGSPRVMIPQLMPLCTPRLTAMERIDGRKVTESGGDSATCRLLAQTLIEALLAKPFWSAPQDEALFHADPHAGNLFATTDGRVAIFDWALTTRLNETQLAAVVHVLLGAVLLDGPGVISALCVLGEVKNTSALQLAVASAIAEVRHGVFPGFEWLTPLLDGLARSATVMFREETALFRKSLLTLTGVARDVWPQISIDAILIRDGGRRFISESAYRALSPFDSRALGTHVSNADLLAILNSAAWTPARYTLGVYAELLAASTRE